MTCTHEIWEKENACADGMCPICMAAEIWRLQDDSRMLALCEEDRKDMAAEIERLKAERNDTKRMLKEILEKHIPKPHVKK